MSRKQGERQYRFRSEFDEESISVENLQEAERMFAKQASMLLIDELGTSDSPYTMDQEECTHDKSSA